MPSFLRNIILLIAAVLLMAAGASAQEPEESSSSGSDPYAGYAEDIYMDMDLEPNIATPVVPDRAREVLRTYVVKLAKSLQPTFQVDMIRDGEVMIISIPTDDLFLPNDTLLAPFSSRVLPKLLPLMSDPYRWKVLISMNTDDTGSVSYRDALSQARLNSVYDWMIDHIVSGEISEDLIIIPFSMASDDPLEPNDTRAHRRTNRRLDVYFVPGPKLITEADSGQL
ncbi:MAG: hypothetical protein NC336_10235 [Clostridium sp.]|nr:hypothetical protein [Clostridium sp.]